MLRARSRRRSMGFTLVEVLAAGSLMAGLQSGGNWRYAVSKAREIRGISNLKQIYQLLMIQSITSPLPRAALYPKGDPKTDPKSIMRLIPGAPPELFVSPFAPEPLRRKKLTYAWNPNVNGKQLDSVPRNTWLLIDLAAFITDPKIPKPKRYLVLYANGKAEAITALPANIQKAVQAAQDKKRGSTGSSSKRKRSKSRKRTSSRDPLKSINKRIPRIHNIPIPPSVPGL